MINLIENTKQILTFDTTNDYNLFNVSNNIHDKLINLINYLEQIPQVYLCARGDSTLLEEHNEIFNVNVSDELRRLFIIGEKARIHIKGINNDDKKYTHYDNNNLLETIKLLIKGVNIIINRSPKSNEISGQIPKSFINNLCNLNLDSLEKWKIFFLSFLHNSAKPIDFKKHSPFLSVAYGYKKYRTARNFALSRCKHKKGMILLYCLNAGWPYYIRTIDLTNRLAKFNVKWYKDIHNEIILMNGIYPHYLLGIFEVKNNLTPKFIVNPWLYELLNVGNSFDYSKGLPIDQTDFIEFAEKKGYSSFFFSLINSNNEFVSNISQTNIHKTIKP